jgi:hypothetical protein
MSPSAAPQTKQDWIERIEPLLHESLDELSERITSAAPIQRWLQEASFEAARDLQGAGDMQAQAQAQAWLMDDLADTFPELLQAVEELTDGHAQLDLNWRPLAPGYTRINVSFGGDFEVDFFWRLPDRDPEHIQSLFATLRDRLPKGTPFPNRPNQVTALVIHEGQRIGVRLFDHLSEAQKRWQTVTLLTPQGDSIEKLSPEDATTRLVQFFADTAG